MSRRDWYLRARAIFARTRVERELDEELSFHIERETKKLLDEGWPLANAAAAARARFGSVPRAADECRDARGVALVDNLRRHQGDAGRGGVRAPLVTATIVATVGLGLGLVAAAFTFLNTFLFRVDRVPHVDQMYAVERARTSADPAPPLTRSQFDALSRDTRVFSGTYAEFSNVDSQVEGRTMTGSLVTANFFEVLGVHAAAGRTLAPDDDRPSAGRLVLVLSDRGWERMFSRDPGILGREVRINGLMFQVIGVMPAGFRGLSVGPPDYWAPLSLLGQMLPAHHGREASVGVGIVGRLAPGMSPQQARAELAAWDAAQLSDEPTSRVSDVVLTPRRGTVAQPLEAVAVTAPLFVAFGLVLLIGCANVANLLLARGVARQREIGIRLSVGATRRRIVWQLLTESLLLALVAAGLGYVVSRVVLTTIVGAVMSSLPVGIGDIRLAVPAADWRVALFLVAGAVGSTAFFGLTPALQATRIEPVRTIRGEVARDGRPGRARNVLIGLQVSASALLLICAAVFLRSTFTAAIEDPGVRVDDIVVVRLSTEQTRGAMVQVVRDDPAVTAWAASWPGALGEPPVLTVEVDGEKSSIACQFVSPEFFDVLSIGVVQGRTFLPAERSSNQSLAVLSESAARRLWPDGRQAVGQLVRLDDGAAAMPADGSRPVLQARTATVVGVVKDVKGFRIAPLDPAVVYVPVSETTAGTSLVARVQGDPDRVRQALVDRFSAIDPNMANQGQVSAMTWVTRMVTYLLWLAFWLTVVLGALALALTLSGLFGVLSYLVERRSREIGIRMALGAAASDVTRLVLWQTIRPVGIGIGIGACAAAGLAVLLLASPAGEGLGGIVRVLDPVSYLAAIAIIVTACMIAASIPASRAARLNPTTTLRQE